MSTTLTVAEVRTKIEAGESVVGVVFTNARGATGTVLDGLSDHKKRQATMTCTEANCTETHVREQSDWNQSYRCRSHSKTKVKSVGGGQSVGGGFTDANGTVFRFQRVLVTDDAETVAQKTEMNKVFEALKAQKVATERAAKEARTAEKRAEQAKTREEKKVKKVAEKKAARAEQVARMRKFAADNNVPINDVTLAQIEKEG